MCVYLFMYPPLHSYWALVYKFFRKDALQCTGAWMTCSFRIIKAAASFLRLSWQLQKLLLALSSSGPQSHFSGSNFQSSCTNLVGKNMTALMIPDIGYRSEANEKTWAMSQCHKTKMKGRSLC